MADEPSYAARLKVDTAGFRAGYCLCETVCLASYDVSGLFWADSFDNSIAARVSSPSQSSLHARPWIYSRSARRFIQLNLSDCTRSRVKKRAIRDDWQAFVFLGHARTYFFQPRSGTLQRHRMDDRGSSANYSNDRLSERRKKEKKKKKNY